MLKKAHLLTRNKSSVGLVALAFIVGGISAQAAGLLNTPSGGYLICVDAKTKVVTHPGTSKCPNASKKIILGAQGEIGATGATGVAGLIGTPGLIGASGLTGAAGSNATLTCAQGGTCVVGATGPGGGIVFYISATPLTATTPWRYLEAAPSTWNGGNTDPLIAWCSGSNTQPYVSNISTGATAVTSTATTIGKGFYNTKSIQRTCSFGAANTAAAYGGGGKSDWFLPSQGELNQMCKWQRNQAWISDETVCNSTGALNTGPGAASAGFGSFEVNGEYWSSSESQYEGRPFEALFQFFTTGERALYNKSDTQFVRPVRTF